MTWKELKDKISLMTEEEQRQEVAVWGENMNLMKDCSLEKTDEDMYYNTEWDYTCEESELEPEDKNDPDVHKVYEAGMHYIYSNCEEKGITWNDLIRIRVIRPKKFLGFFRQLTGITIEGAFNSCSDCVEIMADDDNGVSMMHYIDYEDIIGVELIKN